MIPVMRIYDGNKIVDVSAVSYTSYTLGFEPTCDYVFHGSDAQLQSLQLERRGTDWVARSALGIAPVAFGKRIWLSKTHIQGICFFNIDQAFQAAAEVRHGVTIGRSPDCSIVIPDERVSRYHAFIWSAGGQCRLTDEKSKNGTYVNGLLTRSAVLAPGDVVSIETQYFIYDGERIASYIPEHLILNEGAISTRPVFSRSPRLEENLEPMECEIEPPPSIGGKPGWSLMAIRYPISAVNTLLQSGKYKKAQQKLASVYGDYIGQMETELVRQHKRWQTSLLHNDPAPQDCCKWPAEKNRRLWERTPTDQDFMSLRIGTGTVPSQYVLKAPKQGLTEDPLVAQAVELAKKSRTLKNVPVVCPCRKSGFIGIVGKYDQCLNLLNNMILESATLHSYDELKIVGFMPKGKRSKWEWMRWLPHCFSDDRQMRFLAQSSSDAEELIKLFSDKLGQRMQEAEESHFQTVYMPFYLFIVADANLISHSTLLNYLAKCGEEVQFATIYLASGLQQLPKECHTIIEIREDAGCIYDKTSIQNKQTFAPDVCSPLLYNSFARGMAPIRVENIAKEEPLPTNVSFLEGYGVKQAPKLDIGALWSKSKARKSLAVPIGIRNGGEPFYLDIHERVHGPNGIVAGMVGSGKTEAIQSWILSMAVHFSPLDVNFVLVDFKGTGLLQPFRKLPHIAGMISNLDANIGRRLKALAVENERRARLFANLGTSGSGKKIEILDYKEMLDRGEVTEQLPFIFLIIDEYAQFKLAFPDFTKDVETLFRLGRAQGIYMILMTQKPAGIVTGQMEDNTGFRLCLKVADVAAGKEMHCPDAANIINPGRAFVETKDKKLTEFQSFYCGAPYRPFAKNLLLKAAPIAVVDLMGRREVYEDAATTGFRSDKCEVNAVVEHLANYASEHQFAPVRRIWTEDLPRRLPLDTLAQAGFDGQTWHGGKEPPGAVLGLVDDPAGQSQYPLKFNFNSCGHIALYGAPGSGKTTFLQTFAMSACLFNSPEEVNLYMMDFGGWSLNMFQSFPHVGGSANDSEEEKVNKLVQLLSDELEGRKKRFASIGVSTLSAYRQVTGEKLPYILLLVDNFGAVLPTYPGLEGFFTKLTREGGNYGVLLVATANTVSAIPYKLKSNIKTSMALQMTDQSMYLDIVGKNDGLMPEDTAGRGLVRLERVLEFQTALPAPGDTEGAVAIHIRELGRQMSEAWNGDRPKTIPVMPEVIAFGSVSCDKVAIGLYMSDISPVTLDFSTNHCVLISGTPGSGKSNVLKVIAAQLSGRGVQIAAFAPAGQGLEAIRGYTHQFCVTGEEMDQYMESLVPELQRRKNAKTDGETTDFEEIAIIIDDWKGCFDLIDNSTVKRLEMIVRLAAGLGVYLVLACDSTAAGTFRNQGETVISALVNGGTNILLGGNLRAHAAFDVDMPYSEKELMLGPNEGYILRKGKAVRFKTMYMEE